MTAESAKTRLRDINKALKVFPKVVKEKERVHREKEKIIKPFMKVAKDLKRRTEAAAKAQVRKARPEIIKHYSEIQEADNSHYPGSDELLSVGSPFGKVFGFKRLGIHHELLKPGRRTSWPHAEKTEEEFVYVIEGRPQAWIDGVVYDLVPGDAFGFVPGTGIAHTFINNTDSDVRLLVVGDASRDDNKCYYPMHPARNAEIKVKGYLWEGVPKRDLGPHDGLPDKLRATASPTKGGKRRVTKKGGRVS